MFRYRLIMACVATLAFVRVRSFGLISFPGGPFEGKTSDRFRTSVYADR